jgi:ABC-2 type transport system permease protein
MLKKYLAFSKVSWALNSEYRSQILIWMMTSLLMVVMLVVWLGVSENGAVNGFSSGDFVAYYMVGWLVRTLTAVWSSWELDAVIRQGTLSPLLLRPIHPIHNEIAANWTEKIFRVALVLPITTVVLLLNPDAHVRLDALSIGAFLLAIAGAWLLVFLSDYLVGMLAFWTSQTSAFITLLYGVRVLFSGIIAPLAMFPTAVQEALRWSPFPYMLNFPAAILTKGVPLSEMLYGFGVQAVWVIGLLLAVRGVWRLAMRSYSAVGA